MDVAAIVQIAGYMLALAFGAIAIRDWRRRCKSVSSALGIEVDRTTLAKIAIGILIAGAAMVVILVVERLAAGIAMHPATPDFGIDAGIGLFLAGNAFIDEVLMRGMLISGLSIVLGGRMIAAVLMSAALFGATHMFFAGASPLSVLSNSLGGVAYGLAFILTGRIWLGLGLHFAWNFVQGPMLGFIVSGHALGSGLFWIDDLGPDWLTGGAYGPEGGIVGLAMRFAVIGAVIMVSRNAYKTDRLRPA
jgi:membrane protease YdiL (CAAX protease family)